MIVLIELNFKYPSSNPFIKLYLLIKGFGWSVNKFVVFSNVCLYAVLLS